MVNVGAEVSSAPRSRISILLHINIIVAYSSPACGTARFAHAPPAGAKVIFYCNTQCPRILIKFTLFKSHTIPRTLRQRRVREAHCAAGGAPQISGGCKFQGAANLRVRRRGAANLRQKISAANPRKKKLVERQKSFFLRLTTEMGSAIIIPFLRKRVRRCLP